MRGDSVRQQRGSARLPLFVAVLLLIGCSSTGLLAGVTAHGITSGTLGAATATSTTSAAQTAQPTEMASPAATIYPTAPMTVEISVTPRTVSPGQTLTITVTVAHAETGQPLAGVECWIRAHPGSRSLLDQWPGPAVTDANGRAVWSIAAPARALGAYTVEAVAYRYNKTAYPYWRYTQITLSA